MKQIGHILLLSNLKERDTIISLLDAGADVNASIYIITIAHFCVNYFDILLNRPFSANTPMGALVHELVMHLIFYIYFY